MPKPLHNRDAFLRLIHELRLADLEMLTAVLRQDGFGAYGIERASESLFGQGLIRRLWLHRDPKSRHDRGSRRKVFMLSPAGAARIGLSVDDAKNTETRWKTLSNPRTEYRLQHELMLARFHASLLLAQKHHPAMLRLGLWHQGEGTQMSADSFRLTPDARLQLVCDAFRRSGWFFLEADTGNERLESDDDSRRTIEQKVRRYGVIDRDAVAVDQFEIPGFSVLFLVPRRASKDNVSGRERGVLATIQKAGMLKLHAPKFYRVLSETDVEAALKNPNHYIETRCLHVITPDGKVQATSFVPQPVHSTSQPDYTEIAELIA